MDEEKQRKIAEEKKMENARQSLLTQILTQEAYGRLNNICLVNPEKGNLIKNALLTMTQRGHIKTKMSEDSLTNFIRQYINPAESSNQNTIKIVRKKQLSDSEEEY